MSNPDQATTDETRRLVIVSGAGRSGTSSGAGALKYLGLHVPTPEVPANAANPRGYFEPQWVVDFHKRLLGKANLETMDARPDILERVAEVTAEPKVSAELRRWLESQREHPQLVVKDPRAFMFRSLWQEAAGAAGYTSSFLTMIRHPAEVVGSRERHYLSHHSSESRAAHEIFNLAGWVNASLLNEGSTRGLPRIFVRYDDLLRDWRGPMRTVASALDLHLNTDLSPDQHHEVDDFIDAGLHRVAVTWEDLEVPAALKDMADQAWQILSREDDAAVEQAASQERLDEIRRQYADLFRESAALAQHQTRAAVRTAKADTRRKVKAELRAKAERERQAAAAKKRGGSGGSATSAPQPSWMRRVPAPAGARRAARVLVRKARAFRSG